MGSALAVSRADRTRLPNCSMRFSLSGGTGRNRETEGEKEEEGRGETREGRRDVHVLLRGGAYILQGWCSARVVIKHCVLL